MLILLKLRVKQTLRLFKEIGWVYSILVFSFLLFFLISLYNSGKYLNTHPIPRLISIVILWPLLASIHFKRPDKVFLALKIKYNRLLYFAEYSLISLPVIFWYIMMGWYYEVILGLCGIFIISSWTTFPAPKKNINNKISFFLTKSLDVQNYMWLGGLRKYWFIIGLLYISSFILLFTQFLSVVLLFCITLLIVPSFYLFFEPLIFIECQPITADRFLMQKIGKHFGFYIILSSPVFILYLIIHPNYFTWVIGNMIISLLIFIWLNYFKYFQYKHSPTPSLIYKYLSNAGVFFAVAGFPVLLVLMLLQRKKFRSNLGYYIHD